LRKTTGILALAAIAAGAFCSTLAYAVPSVADILAANKAATGGAAWDGKSGLTIHYAYAGQGMTGSVLSVNDLKTGRWMDDAKIGPVTQTQGFDGARTWLRDQSGTVTEQSGGDSRALAFNEGYRRANLWWRPGFGGGAVVYAGERTDGSAHYDVLTVTPKDGKSFDAWFDATSHLLVRIVEKQGPETATTTLSDYRAVYGVELPYKTVVSVGDRKYDQTMTVASAAFGAVAPDAAFAMPENKVADFSIAGGAASTTIPFQLINNHIYATASVNGKPFTFIFDTGGVNVITPPTAEALGLKTEGHIQGNGGGEGHMDFSLTKVQSLQVGDAVIKDQVFPVAPLNALSPMEGVNGQGMVGFETFRRFVTIVDYGAKKLTLIDPKMFDPKDSGSAIPFQFDGNVLVIEASYGGRSGHFIVDTGARMSLTLNGPFVKANGFAPGAARSVEGVTGWGIGGATRAIVMHGDTLKIGPYTVDRPVTELSTDTGGSNSSAALSGNIGAGILKRFVVTLDYNRSTLYLKPVTGPISDLDTFDRAGMWFNEDPKGFKVYDVMKGTPADEAGLKAGDVITAVDGKKATDLHLYDVRRRFRDDAPGTAVTLTVANGAATHSVKLTLRDLI